MSVVAFDTLKILEKLKAHEFTDAQVRGIIEAWQSVDTSEISTKGDIKQALVDLKSDLAQLELRLENRLKDYFIKTGAMIFTLGSILIAVKFLGH